LIRKNILILLFVHPYPAVVDLVFIQEYFSFLTDAFCLGRVKRKNMKKGEKGAKEDEDADED